MPKKDNNTQPLQQQGFSSLINWNTMARCVRTNFTPSDMADIACHFFFVDLTQSMSHRQQRKSYQKETPPRGVLPELERFLQLDDPAPPFEKGGQKL
ncbi:MAG: hypothetical protein IJW95_01405 [Clostridia bacterium]|nr:hypothetical protein [Clostridia bacterium]